MTKIPFPISPINSDELRQPRHIGHILQTHFSHLLPPTPLQLVCALVLLVAAQHFSNLVKSATRDQYPD